ncbi:MAG: hypothetical protein AAB354_07985 [candidate division KSB1 bacterium]
MLSSVIRFVRLPLVMLAIWAVGRFAMGLFGVPYGPRPNATFSVVVLTLITSIYYGALSNRIGGFDWKGTALVGASIGVVGQLLIIVFTLVSLIGGLETYFVNWDAINLPEGTAVTVSTAVTARATGFFVNVILATLEACVGRLLFSGLVTAKA